jgi:hypothetical protein
MKTTTFALALIAATVSTGIAHADGNYAGAGISLRTHYGLDCVAGVSCDRNANASGKVYLGHDFEIFGAEAFAFRLGKARGGIDGPAGRLAGRVDAEGLGAVGTARMHYDAFTFKARLGAAYEHGRTRYDDGSSGSKNSLVSALGAGVSYSLNKQWALNADWDLIGGRFNSKQKAGVSLYTVGASYNF